MIMSWADVAVVVEDFSVAPLTSGGCPFGCLLLPRAETVVVMTMTKSKTVVVVGKIDP
jgi:hypothetical protein